MPLTHEALNDLRARVLAGEDVSVEEYAELINTQRIIRAGAVTDAAAKKAATPAKKSTASSKAPVDLPDLLKDL